MIRPTFVLLGTALLSSSLIAKDTSKLDKPASIANPAEAKSINPQPEPPGKQSKVKPGDPKAINPQPEPPGTVKGLPKDGGVKPKAPQPDSPSSKSSSKADEPKKR